MATPLFLSVYKDGRLLGRERVEREIVKIGRLSTAHLRLDDEKVARIHAILEVSPSGQIHVIDMGSSEGTFLNGERVHKGRVTLGDELKLGDTRVVIEAAEAAAVVAPGPAANTDQAE